MVAISRTLRHAGEVTTSHTDARTSGQPGPALDVVIALSGQLERLTFPLELPGAEHARQLRDRIGTQLTSHLLPRLKHASLPALVVVGGPTGSGKSTLVNAIAQDDVSQAGVVRPTTRKPVLVVNPKDAELMAEHPVAQRSEVVTAQIPRGLALVDAPDLDSVHEENRSLAVQLIEVADVWLFVTTATRYGDALPWTILDQVRRRGVTVGVVLDRVPAEALDTVRRDLLARLDEAGLASVPLFVVPDAGPLTERLEPTYVSEVSSWLELIATRAGSREVVARTIRGVWSPLRAEVRELLESVMEQVEAASDLTAVAIAVTPPIAGNLAETVRQGALAEGAVTARWLAEASSRGPLEALPHEATGMLARRRVGRSASARHQALGNLLAELRESFDDVVGTVASTVSATVRQAWREHSEAGRVLAESTNDAELAADRAQRLESAWNDWLDLVGRLRAPDDAETPAGASADLLTRDGERDLIALAAAGLTGAESASIRLIRGADTLIDRARTALVAASEGVVDQEAGELAGQVSSELAPEAAAALRVRVGELRHLAGEG